LLLSLASFYEGIKNSARFIWSERLKYYLVGLLLSLVYVCFFIFSSKQLELGLVFVTAFAIAVVLGSVFYYIHSEGLKDLLEIKFRMMKYLLVIFTLLFLIVILGNIG